LTDALSRETNYVYDDFNRLVKITYPPAANGATRLFQSFVYDAVGNVTQHTDTAGRLTNYVYDNAERVAGVTDPDLKTTNFEYDALSRVTAVVDALNQRYQFAYDPLGRQTQITRAGIPMTYAYDAVGNRTQRTDYNGSVTNYGYDNLNRLTTITYPTRTVTYSYDPLNNLTRATNENGSVYIGYDNRYRVSSLSDPFFYGISYNYDAAGNRTKLKVNGATYASYTYDAVNRVISLADSANLSFNYSYDAANRLTARSAPNGVTSSYAYDDLDRLTGMMHAAGATTLSGNLYTYNNANNISSWTTASAQRAYTYDALNRLTGASNFELPTENYSYDAVGNRTASHLSTSYSYQPFNKLMSTASASYSYDNNGNLVHKIDASGTRDFYYDEENRLTQVTLPNGSTVNYKYDGLGRRIQRTTNAGASERYIYDGADALIDLNADWSVATTYLNGSGIDNHLRQTSATTGVSYFLTDHLGSTAGLTDASGNLVEQSAYDSFGNSAGSPRTRYGYTGRERDPDTGLLYYRARFYDPQVGRFISEDPIGLGGGINQFGYVGNNPQNRVDPSGLYDIDVHYYLTYYLALHTHCLQDWEAREIAEHDQRSDEDREKKPGLGITKAQRSNNIMFHAFGTPEQNDRRAAELLSQAFRNGGNIYALGTYLHFLQDSFSHHDYSGNSVIGQSPGGESVDHTNFDPDKAFKMAIDTYEKLREFGEMRGCRCNGDPDWEAVKKFISVGYDLSTRKGRAQDFAREVSDEQLRRKIGILNTPWRSPNGR